MSKRTYWAVMAIMTEDCFEHPVRFAQPGMVGLLPVYQTKAAALRAHPQSTIVPVQRVTPPATPRRTG